MVNHFKLEMFDNSKELIVDCASDPTKMIRYFLITAEDTPSLACIIRLEMYYLKGPMFKLYIDWSW